MAVPENVRTHTQAPDESVVAEANSHVQIVRIALGKETLAVVLLLTIVIGACGLIMGLNLAKQERLDETSKELAIRYRLLERRLMDREALDILHGEKLPSDTEFGPTGNLQRMKPKEQTDGR